jgi:hypothetical protein
MIDKTLEEVRQIVIKENRKTGRAQDENKETVFYIFPAKGVPVSAE